VTIDDDALAREILSAADEGRLLAPVAARRRDFDLAAAYRVSGLIFGLRRARGETPVGWKIGFTNRTIWDEYGVHAPIWGPMYDSTFAEVGAAAPFDWSLGGLAQPRIEPEILFRFARAPQPGMDEIALLSTVDAIAHGVEVVQSLFPDWRFAAADCVAAFALHGAYRCGPFVPVSSRGADAWRADLERFTIVLERDGVVVDRGAAANVLGGPLSALRRFVSQFDPAPFGRGIEAGDVVTTGTVTRAFPVRAGETWRTSVEGLRTPSLEARFA
jgi:2-keto-4-pentenoate hydratase